MNKENLKKNVLFGFGGQIVVIILGIVIPRMIIKSYGSDTNGLLSTVTQIFTYMALLEAGISQAARNELYKPLIKKDKNGISYIVTIARRYFRKITIYYGIGVIILALSAPFILKTNLSFVTVFLIIFFEGMSGVFSFYFIQTPITVLGADGRGYINNSVIVINKILSYSVKIIIASFGINIIILQVSYFIITITKVLFYQWYFKKNYGWINYNSAPSTAKLKDRNSYIVTEITWTIFSSTDMIVLSTFLSTQLSSVYAVYNMVFTNLNVLLNAVYQSIIYVLGQTYNEDKEKYKVIHDVYNSVFMGLITILMSVAYLLIIPFIKLYTRGVSDTNYIYSTLPFLFCLVQLLSWSRYVAGNLIGVAGRIKKSISVNIGEAAINLVLSIILVKPFGIVGVLVATVVALPLKVIYCNYIADKIILNRSLKNTMIILGVNYGLFLSLVFFSQFMILNIHNYFQFGLYGILLMIFITILVTGINVLVNRNCLPFIKRILKIR